MKHKHAVLLASGGLDSTTLAYWLIAKGIEFIPVFIDYGQHCAQTELATLRHVLPAQLAERVQVITVTTLYSGCNSKMLHAPDLWIDRISDDDLYVPFRNQLILTMGAAVAESRGAEQVFSAFIEANVAKGKDCTTAFLNEMNALISRYSNVSLEFPFMELTKRQVAVIGLELNAPLAETYSCLAAPAVPCGACPNCVDRNDALLALPR